jgi:phenylacetate-CoA ligase
VATDLNNYAMPFIRYEVGDFGAMVRETDCSCGRHTQRLSEIVGRDCEFVSDADGKRVYNAYFSRACAKQWIGQYFVFQNRQKDITITVVPTQGNNDALRDSLRDEIQNRFPSILVRVDLADRVPLTRGGKYRFVVSEVSAVK